MKLLHPEKITFRSVLEEREFLNEYNHNIESDKTTTCFKYVNGSVLVAKTLGSAYVCEGKTNYYFYNDNKNLFWSDADHDESENGFIYNNMKVYVLDEGIATVRKYSKRNLYSFYRFKHIKENKNLKTRSKQEFESFINAELDERKCVVFDLSKDEEPTL